MFVFKSLEECQKHVDANKMFYLKNAGMELKAVRAEIVDVDKFRAPQQAGIGFGKQDENDVWDIDYGGEPGTYWSDFEGNKISDEPFKKGDIAYLALCYPVWWKSDDTSAFEEREGVRILKE